MASIATNLPEENGLRKRIEQLNTKAYYLLVALSFIYGKDHTRPTSLKVAFTLTALAAILPVQDYLPQRALECVRFLKVVCLIAALGFTLYSVW